MKKYILYFEILSEKEMGVVLAILTWVAFIPVVWISFLNPTYFFREFLLNVGSCGMILLSGPTVFILKTITKKLTKDGFLRKALSVMFLVVLIMFLINLTTSFIKGFLSIDNDPLFTLLWVVSASFTIWTLSVFVPLVKKIFDV